MKASKNKTTEKIYSDKTLYIKDIYLLFLVIEKLTETFRLSYGGDTLITNSPFLNETYTMLRKMYFDIINKYKESDFKNTPTLSNVINFLPEYISDFMDIEADFWWNDQEKEKEFNRLREIINREIHEYRNSKDYELEDDYFTYFPVIFSNINLKGMDEGLSDFKKIKINAERKGNEYLDKKYPKEEALENKDGVETGSNINKDNDNSVYFDKESSKIISNKSEIKITKGKDIYYIIKYLFERENIYEDCFYDEIIEAFGDKSKDLKDKNIYDNLLRFKIRLKKNLMSDLFNITSRFISINKKYNIKDLRQNTTS